MESATASSTVLGIPELLLFIIGHSEQQTLARLAQVSASFHQISIAYLWSRRDLDLWDLLNLFPGGIVERPYVWSKEWVLKRAPQDPDWDRVQHYSVYVTRLAVSTGNGPASLITSMADQSQLFFPRLRDLTIRATSQKCSSSECIRLAGQALRSLEVNGSYLFGEGSLPYNPEITGPFFQHLMDHVPKLTKFKIQYFPASHASGLLPPALVDTICLLIRSSPCLRHLDWNLEHPKAILAAIAAHPSIEHLALSRTDAWPTMGSENLYFPSLKFIKLWCSRAAGDAVAESISYPDLLSKVDISFLHWEDNISPHFFQPFSRVFGLSVKLTDLRLEFGMHSMSWAQLRPLLHCRLLVNLIIWTVTPMTGFDDEGVKDLASSLPNLEALRLIPRNSNVSLIQVTLLGLISLSRLTPRLCKLSIQVTTRVRDPSMVDALLQFQPAIPHPLYELDLCSSDLNIDDDTPEFMGARRTAGALQSMWSSLKSNGVWFGWGSSLEPEPTMNAAWEGVRRHLEQSEQDGTSISFL